MNAVASLPMYDWPETVGAREAFWARVRDGLRARGVSAPDHLSSGTAWRDPGLVFGQTCGWPWATTYREVLDPVAVPTGDCAGCGDGTYSSAVIVRADARVRSLSDLRGVCVAFNGTDSQSGVHALREAVAPLAGGEPFFGRGIRSGAHRESIRMVARGEADCAAIDAVCWAMARLYETQAVAKLRVVHTTAPAPALPFVTRRGGPVTDLRAVLEEAIAEGFGEPLLIRGLTLPDPARYDALVGRVAMVPALF